MRLANSPIFLRAKTQKSQPDPRDHLLKLTNTRLTLKSSINLGPQLPFVFDQGQLGSCTANSAGSMYSWIVRQNNGQLFIPSRLFLYYNTRVLHGTTWYDSGASLRNTMRALRTHGVCPETMWPYLYNQLTIQPTMECYTEGATRQAMSYAAVSISLQSMKTVLQNRPFVLGILVYTSFYNPSVSKTGMVPVPDLRKERLLGGHAILVMGYDDRKKCFLCRNSWGTSWGLKGDFYLPYSYATNRKLSFDAWVLHSVEVPIPNTRVIRR